MTDELRHCIRTARERGSLIHALRAIEILEKDVDSLRARVAELEQRTAGPGERGQTEVSVGRTEAKQGKR
jgi:hypothetical protein